MWNERKYIFNALAPTYRISYYTSKEIYRVIMIKSALSWKYTGVKRNSSWQQEYVTIDKG